MAIGRVVKAKQGPYTLDMVGTDTEVFLRDIVTGKPVPVIGLIGGTKHNPKPVPELGNGFCVQEDNVMLEYNVPPARNKQEFVNNIIKMNSFLDQLLASKGLKADICASMEFTKTQLHHPQAQHIGCEHDFDVWRRIVNPSPKENPLMQKIRTSGGHLHISFLVNEKPTDNILDKEPIVKACDLTLGVPALILDKDTQRRQLYGRPGAFRNKDEPYSGIEYRTLSNFWTQTPELMAWAFEGVKKAIYLANYFGHEITNDSSVIRDTFAHKTEHKMQEYVSYLMTKYNMLDRANILGNCVTNHTGTMPIVGW